MKISLVVAGFMALLVSPALAAEEFFVVQNEKGNCKISNKKDDGENKLIGTAGYATAENAKAAKAPARRARKAPRSAETENESETATSDEK